MYLSCTLFFHFEYMVSTYIKKEDNSLKKYLSVTQAATYMGYKSPKTVYQLIKLGLPVIHIDNKVRIDKDDIDCFMKKHKSVCLTSIN